MNNFDGVQTLECTVREIEESARDDILLGSVSLVRPAKTERLKRNA